MINETVEGYIKLMYLNALKDRRKEAEVIQCLRTSKNLHDVQLLAGAMLKGGSCYCVPVLKARFYDYTEDPVGLLLLGALLIIKSRMDWNEDSKEILFEPYFFANLWLTGHAKFLSFIKFLSIKLKDTVDLEVLGNKIASEFFYDFTPFKNLKDLEDNITDWNFTEDMDYIMTNLETNSLMEDILRGTSISYDYPDKMTVQLALMRLDYLVTRLHLADNMPKALVFMNAALILNYGDQV